MKYLQEIAVAALVVIAATSVYKIMRHKHHCHKRDDVTIQNASGSGPGPFGGKAKQKRSTSQSS